MWPFLIIFLLWADKFLENFVSIVSTSHFGELLELLHRC
jgi:hypothetical protein